MQEFTFPEPQSWYNISTALEQYNTADEKIEYLNFCMEEIGFHCRNYEIRPSWKRWWATEDRKILYDCNGEFLLVPNDADGSGGCVGWSYPNPCDIEAESNAEKLLPMETVRELESRINQEISRIEEPHRSITRGWEFLTSSERYNYMRTVASQPDTPSKIRMAQHLLRNINFQQSDLVRLTGLDRTTIWRNMNK